MASKPKKCEITRRIRVRWWFNRNFKVITIAMLAMAVVLLAVAILLAISPYSWSGEMTRGFFLGSYFHRAEEVRMGADEVDEVVVVVPSPEVVIPDASVPVPAPKPEKPTLEGWVSKEISHFELLRFMEAVFPVCEPRGPRTDWNYCLMSPEALASFMEKQKLDDPNDLVLQFPRVAAGMLIDPEGIYLPKDVDKVVIVAMNDSTETYILGIDPRNGHQYIFRPLSSTRVQELKKEWENKVPPAMANFK